MKQKIYNLIIIILSIVIFGSFLIANFNEAHENDDFEIIIVNSDNNTRISEISALTSIYSSYTANSSSYETKTTVISRTTASSESLKTTSVPEKISGTEIYSEPLIFPVNINTAEKEDLMKLDGIGEVTADAIIEYRNTYGFFKNRDELINIDGIGEKKLAAIYDLIFVENESFDIYDDYNDYDNNYDDDYIPEISEEPTEEYSEYSETQYQTETDSPETTVDIIITETTEPLLINLNTASKEDFMKLPYVDEAVADDILTLREKIQYFSHPYELLMVESLTKQQVAEIINFVTVDNDTLT